MRIGMHFLVDTPDAFQLGHGSVLCSLGGRWRRNIFDIIDEFTVSPNEILERIIRAKRLSQSFCESSGEPEFQQVVFFVEVLK